MLPSTWMVGRASGRLADLVLVIMLYSLAIFVFCVLRDRPIDM